jgi:hypothetical protein
MGWAYTSDPDTWIGSTDATYSNQFKWLVVEGMDAPNDVVNIQKPGFAAEIGIYMNFPDAAFNAVYMNGVLATNDIEYKQDGAGIVIYLSALSAKNTEIVIKQGETIRWGLNVYNAKGEGEGGEGTDPTPKPEPEPGVVDWSAYEWLGNSSGNEAYTSKIKVAPADGQTVVNLQKPGWAAEAGIYTYFGAGIQSCSLPEGKYAIDGAGICLYLSAFTAKETEVTVVDALKTYVFTVYYEDGVAGGAGTEGGLEYDVNFALASNGATATASSGNADAAIDGNNGTRWESEATDDETFTLNMGKARTFNYVRINWEGAFCSQFELTYSTDGVAYQPLYTETALAAAGWQEIYFEAPVTAQYIKYHGTKRATGWGQSFYEFQVLLQEGAPMENIAVGKSIYASSTGNNDVNRVVDGNGGTEWQGSATNGTAGDEEARTYDAWFVVDLGAFYDIAKVSIVFEGACSQAYHVDFSADANTWKQVFEHNGNAGVNGHTKDIKFTVDNKKVRYIRFWSTKAATEWGMKIYEFQVYGTPWKDSGDTEKPVMGAATVASKTGTSAVINVAATDNGEVVAYHVVDATNNIDVKLGAIDGKITINNLVGGTTYNFTITAIDGGENESENNAVVTVTTDAYTTEPTVAAPVPTWPADQVKSLYSNSYPFAPASLNSYNEGWWAPPVMTEKAIEGNNYLHYTLAQAGMIGVQFAETSIITMEYFHIDVWASKDGSITIRPITVGGPEPRKTLELVGGKWNSFDIPMTDFPGHDWTKLFQYTIENWEAGGLTGEYIAVDNVFFYRTTAIEDTEKPANVTATAVSTDYFSALIAVSATDNMGVVNYTVKNGDKILATGAAASGMTTSITVPGLLPNTEYTLAVIASDDKGNAADPVSVNVKTAVAPAAAPVPDFSKYEKVAAIYSDVAEGTPFINIGGWGQSTVVINGQLAEGDNVMFFTNMNYLGWELAPAVDATDMEFLHVDFYATDMTTVNVTPISPGHEGVATVTLNAGAWTSADIPLSTYAAANIEWNNIFQFKFMDAAPVGKSLFVDNVYFYKTKANVGFENVESTNAAIKVMENGVVYIIRDGVKYTTFGQKVQ